jgi:excisionase family DNA binding protein
MPRSKTNARHGGKTPTKSGAARRTKTSRVPPVEWPEVLTLAEAAAYLRVTEAELSMIAGSQGLPGQRIGSEWRFSRAAIQDWLRRPSMKQRLLQSAGSWKDDPYLDDLLRELERQRERTEDEERR